MARRQSTSLRLSCNFKAKVQLKLKSPTARVNCSISEVPPFTRAAVLKSHVSIPTSAAARQPATSYL